MTAANNEKDVTTLTANFRTIASNLIFGGWVAIMGFLVLFWVLAGGFGFECTA